MKDLRRPLLMCVFGLLMNVFILFHKAQHVRVLPHSLTFYGHLSKIISSWPQLRQDTPWLNAVIQGSSEWICLD